MLKNKDMVGEIYSVSPRMNMLVLLAPFAKSTRGKAVNSPQNMSRKYFPAPATASAPIPWVSI